MMAAGRVVVKRKKGRRHEDKKMMHVT